jgi:universal stress protein A
MGQFKNILCATDFSADSDRAVARALELAAESGAKLTLLHVIEHFPVDRSGELIAPEDVDPAVFRRQKAEEALQAEAERIGHPELRWEVVTCLGGAGREIVDYAKVANCDLIVVGSSSHKGKPSFWSVPGCVQRHASMPVEVVYPD